MSFALAERPAVREAHEAPRLSFKQAPEGSMAGEVLDIDEAEGIVTAIVSVTGVVDEVADIILPGAYAATLQKRNPKVCWAHSWEHPIGKVLEIEELHPGDRRLPSRTRDGQPWPKAAGALVAKMQFNLRTTEGKEAFEVVRFYSDSGECEYSIGYQVPPGKSASREGIRYIKALELYELSVVLFGAHTMTGTLSLKSAYSKALESKVGKKAAGVDFAAMRPSRFQAKVVTPPDAGSAQNRPDHSDGVMVAIFPDPAAADAIANHIAGPDDTTPRNDLHVTLAYLGKVGEAPSEQELVAAVTRAVEGTDVLEGQIGGIGQFPAGEDGTPTWAPVDVPGLGLLREQIVNELGDAVYTDHGFTPHMTLGYDIGLIPAVPATPLKVSAVRVVHGNSTQDIALGKPFPEAKSSAYDPTLDVRADSYDPNLDVVASAYDPTLDVKAEGGADRNRGGAEKLRRYWTTGEGGLKIAWGTPGDFTRCVGLLEEHMPGRAEGYCFTGDTEFMTRDGVTTFAEAVGTDRLVLTQAAPDTPEGKAVRRDGRWVEAPIMSFGEQRVLTVTLRRAGQRKVIRATPEHRWFASPDAKSAKRLSAQRLTTADLRPGMALASLMPRLAVRHSHPSPFGVAAGVVFGDGSRESAQGARVDLWGDKDANLLPYFEDCRQYPIKTQNGVLGVRVAGMPSSWKNMPALDEGVPYLYGWLAGYLAADGHVTKNGAVSISSARRDHLEFAATVANRLGISTHPITSHERKGYNAEPTPLYKLPFVAASVPAALLLIPEHRRNFDAATKGFTATRWVVESVEDHGEAEEVFCAVVPDTETFALTDYIFVSNCANRHKEMTGMWPGDRDNKADAVRPEQKSWPHIPGSAEERQSALRQAIWDQHGNVDADSNLPTLNVWIVATFDDHVIYTLTPYNGADETTYAAAYSFVAGTVLLDEPEPVDLVVTPVLHETGDEEFGAADAIPLPERLLEATAAIKMANQSVLEGKAGRVLSGANERALIAALQGLVDVLAAAGVNIDPANPGAAPEPRGNRRTPSDERIPVDPAVDYETTSPEGSRTKALADQPVVLDAAEVAAMLASFEGI